MPEAPSGAFFMGTKKPARGGPCISTWQRYNVSGGAARKGRIDHPPLLRSRRQRDYDQGDVEHRLGYVELDVHRYVDLDHCKMLGSKPTAVGN